MTPMEQLKAMVAGKKVAFIGAGVSHKPCITMLAALGADITLCDQKKSLDDFGDYADTLRKLNVKLSLGEHYTDGFAGQGMITLIRCARPETAWIRRIRFWKWSSGERWFS